MPFEYDERQLAADAEIIQHKARKLRGHYGYTRTDIEDLEQELTLHVFRQSPKFNPARGNRAAFVTEILRNKIASIIVSRTAIKRNPKHDVFIDNIPEPLLLDGVHSRKRIDLCAGVQDAISRMPLELQDVARLRGEYTEAEITQQLGLTRSAVRHRLGQIKAFLENEGFGPNQKS